MKLLALIHSLDGGGAERVMAGLATRLAARGHDVTLVTLDDGSRDRHSVGEAVHRRYLDVMRESPNAIAAAWNLRRRVHSIADAITEVRPDAVLSFCDATNIVGVMAARRTGVPIVISERSDPAMQRLGRAYEFLRRRTYPRASAIVAQSEGVANFLRRIVRDKTAVSVIPSAADVPPLMSDRTIAIANRRIIAVGRLEHEKGFDRLIEAFASISHDHPDWSLRIIGEGSRRESLQTQIAALGLSGRVTLAGWVRPVWAELAAGTMFVLPSRYEGFPSALMEAMATGVPSVAVDCPGGVRSIVDDGADSLLVDNSIEAIAAGIHRMIDNEGVRETMGQRGRLIVDRFGWDAMTDAYGRVLASSIADP